MEWNPIHDEIDYVYYLPVITQTLPPHQHTNSFLLGRREMGMVDAGLWDEKALESLLRFLQEKPGRELRKLFLTHWHPDHCVGAERIKKETGCEVGLPFYETGRGEPELADFTFQDGDRFRFDGKELEVIHTPGHSAGHCCFFLKAAGVLFTGDHILGRGTSIIVPPDGDMALYMESLERLLAWPVKIICPGHGPLVWDAKEKIREYIDHRTDRERKVLEGVRQGLKRPDDLVKKVYTDVPTFFHGMAYYTVQAHLVKLEREGKVRKRQGEDIYDPA